MEGPGGLRAAGWQGLDPSFWYLEGSVPVGRGAHGLRVKLPGLQPRF